MALPSFNEFGDLPPGIHFATLREVLERFGTASFQRQMIASRLERVTQLVRLTGEVARIIIYGSFVTDKPDPNDVDLFLMMQDTFEIADVAGEARLVFDHPAADAHFGASVFWMRPLAMLGSESAMIEFWQTKRDGTLRGVVELILGDQ